MKALLTLIITSTALLVACAPGKSTPAGVVDSSGPAPSQKADYVNFVPAAKAGHVNAELFCKSSCPTALGMFIERLDDNVKSQFNRCTAFLIAKDIVATNAHCLSNDLRANGAPTNSRVSIVFGAAHARTRDSQDTPAETVAVTQVLSATPADPSDLHPDLAFLKLEHEVNREPMKLSRQGVADRETLTAYVIDMTGDETHLNGMVRAVNCVANQNSLIAPQFTTDFANVVSARCALARGHSGSPVLADDGFVHAVVHAVLPADRSLTGFKNYKMPSKFASAVRMTNMSCAQTPIDIGPAAGVCSNPPPTTLELLKTLAASRSFDYDNAYSKWDPPVPFGFEKYELKSDKAIARSVMPRAICVKDAKSWGRAKDTAALKIDRFEHTKHDVILTYTVPLWGLVPELDQDERLTPTLGERDRIHVIVQFDLESFVKSGTARVTQTMTSDNGLASAQPSTFDLPLCH